MLFFCDKTAGQHPLISGFMKGARPKWPVSRQMVPLWDLSIVLEALSQHTFEPSESIGLKFLSLKMALLVALVTAKCVSDLQALSVSPSCLQFFPGLTKVSFRPNPAFVLKSWTQLIDIQLQNLQLSTLLHSFLRRIRD